MILLKKIGSTLLFFTLVWIGCTGVPSGAITEYRLTIGTATMDDFIALSNRTLNRHRYIVDRTEDRGTGAIVECKNEYPGISNEEALQGIIEIKLPNSVTNAMKAGRYVYDIEIKQTSTGEIGRVIEGQVQITAGVTRD